MHLADAFIQSDLQCIQAIHFFFFYQYVCSLGIEPMTFRAANNALPLSHRNIFLEMLQKISVSHTCSFLSTHQIILKNVLLIHKTLGTVVQLFSTLIIRMFLEQQISILQNDF